MWLLTKELALAVVKSHAIILDEGGSDYCAHCDAAIWKSDDEHTPECIVTRAKLLLSVEYGVKC